MKKILIFSLIAFFLVGCKDNEESSAEPKNEEALEKTEEVEEESVETWTAKEAEYYDLVNPSRELTETEKLMLRKPGIFSGENYDEMKLKEELDKLPDNLTTEEYLEEMIHLLAEDYHEEVETFVNFDPNVEVNVEKPDETINRPELKKTHLALLIDASGSMRAKVGGKTKMDSAKQSVKEFARLLTDFSTISLRSYGNEGTGDDKDKALSCSSTEQLYQGEYDQKAFDQAVNELEPAGWTPIALALNSVVEDIPTDADEVIVYIVSDGIETCDGDPVAAAKSLIDSDIQTIVNIIGFDVDNEGQKLLKEVAKAGGGEFTYVNSEQELKRYMREQYEELQKKWLEWKEAGKELALNLKEEKKELAHGTKEVIKEKSDREKERLKIAEEYLKEKYTDFNHPVRKLYPLIIDRGRLIWSYAVDTGNGLWREAVDSGNAKWRDYVDEGNQKINETIQKKNSGN